VRWQYGSEVTNARPNARDNPESDQRGAHTRCAQRNRGAGEEKPKRTKKNPHRADGKKQRKTEPTICAPTPAPRRTQSDGGWGGVGVASMVLTRSIGPETSTRGTTGLFRREPAGQACVRLGGRRCMAATEESQDDPLAKQERSARRKNKLLRLLPPSLASHLHTCRPPNRQGGGGDGGQCCWVMLQVLANSRMHEQ